MSRDEETLPDIIQAGRLAVEFVGSATQAEFVEDLKTQSAVLHQLMLLGEAVKRLSEEFREAHSEIPWRLIAGMRDRLIHHYEEVDLEEVWMTVNGDVPQLIAALEPLAPREE